MTPVELVALAASTSLLAGWRLYLVTLVTGLAMKFGFVPLPDQLQALDILSNNWVLAIAASAPSRNSLPTRWLGSTARGTRVTVSSRRSAVRFSARRSFIAPAPRG